MYLVSAEVCKNAWVGFKRIRKTGEIWTGMKDVGSGMGVKNISDLVLKEIHGILKIKNPTKEQIKKYKMTERETFKEFGNLREKELNTKSNKNVVMATIIKHCRSVEGLLSNLGIKTLLSKIHC